MSRLLNPGSVVINTSGLKTEEMVSSVLDKIKDLPKPDCAGQVSTTATCSPLVVDYSGSVPKASLGAGDGLYVNSYKLILTQVSGGGGQFTGSGPGRRFGGGVFVLEQGVVCRGVQGWPHLSSRVVV